MEKLTPSFLFILYISFYAKSETKGIPLRPDKAVKIPFKELIASVLASGIAKVLLTH